MSITPDIHQQIAELIERTEAVGIGELRAVFESIGGVECPYDEGTVFRIAGRRLVIQRLDGKPSDVPRHSIREFRDLMIELDFFTS